jgi:hypothetical protein
VEEVMHEPTYSMQLCLADRYLSMAPVQRHLYWHFQSTTSSTNIHLHEKWNRLGHRSACGAQNCRHLVPHHRKNKPGSGCISGHTAASIPRQDGRNLVLVDDSKYFSKTASKPACRHASGSRPTENTPRMSLQSLSDSLKKLPTSICVSSAHCFIAFLLSSLSLSLNPKISFPTTNLRQPRK